MCLKILMTDNKREENWLWTDEVLCCVGYFPIKHLCLFFIMLGNTLFFVIGQERRTLACAVAYI